MPDFLGIIPTGQNHGLDLGEIDDSVATFTAQRVGLLMEEGRGEASQMRLVSTRHEQAERAAQRAVLAREREGQRISREAERHEDVVAKTRRLRELRLAKEAVEREAAKADARELTKPRCK